MDPDVLVPLDGTPHAVSDADHSISGLVEAELRDIDSAPPADELLALLPNARLAFLGDHDSDANFELVVRALIEGVHARLSDVS